MPQAAAAGSGPAGVPARRCLLSVRPRPAAHSNSRPFKRSNSTLTITKETTPMGNIIHGCIEYRAATTVSGDYGRNGGGGVGGGGGGGDGREWAYWGRIGPLEEYPGMNIWRAGIPCGNGLLRPPVIPPRGLPPDAAAGTLHEFCLEVRPDPGLDDRALTPEQVSQWTRQGGVEWYDESRRLLLDERWRTPTWMTSDEFAARLSNTVPGSYALVLTVLRILEEQGCAARVVLWKEG
ncbi:MAG: hypothetical protein JWM59_2702 [Verrucomicrobiales bacterium]|nr:hypothetical protein [Verrucomicrobiales bacterium]